MPLRHARNSEDGVRGGSKKNQQAQLTDSGTKQYSTVSYHLVYCSNRVNTTARHTHTASLISKAVEESRFNFDPEGPTERCDVFGAEYRREKKTDYFKTEPKPLSLSEAPNTFPQRG